MWQEAFLLVARFNQKMLLHFPRVFPLISDRSVWHNGKHRSCHLVQMPSKKRRAHVGFHLQWQGRSRRKKLFSSDWAEKLAKSDKGSYFNQEQIGWS